MKTFQSELLPAFFLIVNSAVYAMQVLQKEMTGEAEHAGLTSDDDVMALVKELRTEDENA